MSLLGWSRVGASGWRAPIARVACALLAWGSGAARGADAGAEDHAEAPAASLSDRVSAAPSPDLPAPSVGPVATEAGPALSPGASPWLRLPGLRPVAVLRVHGGGLVITDSGSQYYFKFNGNKSVRLGVKVAF